ncbi:MAG TPA: hypothetical protein VFS08_11520 [Gemmatimonadaceae bacterium]|nr:hypothetical protein [Gemmatimonadaceae bacterium]
MPKSSSAAAAASSAPSTPAATPSDDAPTFPLDVLRARADWLARAAKEACRQHLRCSDLCGRPDVDVQELNGILELAAVADRLLGEAAEAYAKAGAKLHPEGDEVGWWKQANALWLAAREHVRRHILGDRLSKRVGSAPSRERLAELHVEYELEASAILSLQQVADAYCRARPQAV